MSNSLERMRANKNIRPEGDAEQLLTYKDENKTINMIDNEIKNISLIAIHTNVDNEIKNTSENESVFAYVAANKKPKFEELHRKDTFWVKNEILDKLHTITKGNKGLKTQIINEAIELFFKKNKI